jgi:putative membrane protein
MAVAAAFTLGACGGADDEGDEFAADTLGAPAATPAPTTDPMADLPSTDGGVVDLLATVDRSEIEAAEVAREKAQNGEVRNYANTMHQEHTRDLEQIRQLVQTAGIQGATMLDVPTTGATDTAAGAGAAPAPPPPTPGMPGQGAIGALQSMHQQTMMQLQSATGAEFDRAYIDSQVSAHQQVLTVLQQLQTRAQNAELQQHITTMTNAVQQHLQQAQQLQGTLSGTGGTGATGAAGDTTSR